MRWTANNLADIPGIAHGFLGIDDALPADTFYCNQKHTAEIVAPTHGDVIADGLFTDQQRPIAVFTADCLPVLIASTDGRHVAAVHGGWKGLRAGILGNALRRFEQARVPRDRLRVAIGPSIKPCCYEVSDDFRTLWAGPNPPWHQQRPAPAQPNALPQPPAMTPHGLWFDLARYGQLLLAEQGIAADQVEVVDLCTCCYTDELGSYRRRTHWPAPRTQQFSWIART